MLHRGSSCSLVRTVDGCIMHCDIISSCQSAAFVMMMMMMMMMMMSRFYSDYEDDADDETGDVISIHDDDSEPDTITEPAAKVSRLSDNVAVTTATEAETPTSEVMTMIEYWQANSYSVNLAADDTDDAKVLFAKCPQLKNAPCLLVDLKPGEMIYLPASWLCEVLTLTFSYTGYPCILKSPGFFPWIFQAVESPGKSVRSWKVLEVKA